MDVFRKGKFDQLTVAETKMKGNVEDDWCGMKCVCVLELRVMKGQEE